MKSTTFGLDSDKIRKLLQMGLGIPAKAGETPGPLDKTVLLEQWLKEKLPTHAAPTQVSPDKPSGKTLSLDVLLDMPVGKLLGPQTSLTMLMALKDYAKAKVKSSERPEVRDVATVVYYAAIACAWVEHQQMISSVSVPELCEAMKTLANKSWVCPDIRTWFDKALRRCKHHA